MKAFCLAIVFASAAVPACANELSAPADKVLIEQSHASRLYSQERIAALEYSLKSETSGGPQLLNEHQAVVDAARTERVRRLVKAALLKVEQAAVGAESVRYKIRVRCKTRRRLVRYPAVAVAAFDSTLPARPTVVASKTEACSVKLRISRKARRPDVAPAHAQMLDYSITVPALAPVAAH